MSRTLAIACITAALLLATAADGLAQSFGGSSTGTNSMNGSFGGTGFGSTNLGSSGGFGSIGLGSGGMGGQSFGTGGFGSSGFGSGGFGSQLSGQTTFGQGNQQFVGRDASDMQAVFTNMGRSGSQFFQQLNRSMSRGNRQTGQQPENVRPPVRVQLHVAFDYDQPTSAAVSQGLQERLVKILADHDVSGAEVALEDRTATLRGTAANESQRLVLENLVRLEPGVSTVVNQMTLAPESADQGSDN